MKKRLIILGFFLGLAIHYSYAQTNYYTFRNTKSVDPGAYATWVGETAVMNNKDASFQVCFKQVPDKPGKYTIHDHLDFSGNGTEKEASIVLLDFETHDQYWSVAQKKGFVKVKIKNGQLIITVKNVNLCKHKTSNCGVISGTITMKPAGS